MHFVRPELISRHSGYGYGFGFGYGAPLKSFVRIVVTLIVARNHNTTQRNTIIEPIRKEVVREEGRGSRGARSGRSWQGSRTSSWTIYLGFLLRGCEARSLTFCVECEEN